MAFDAELLYKDSEVIVTALTLERVSKPLVIEGETVIENGYRAVFAEFRNQWHDVARVFRPDGEFTGYYADINTPSRDREDGSWTKDLFLDLWISADRSKVYILDEDEFSEALDEGWISKEEGARARVELKRLKERFNRGEFPPRMLEEYA
jgi:predicted RNA-binding protein associated with RNAse of E/G family